MDTNFQKEIMERLDRIEKAVSVALAEDRTPTRYINTETAAKLMNRSPDTIRRQIQNGTLPAVKKGKQWIINQANLIT